MRLKIACAGIGFDGVPIPHAARPRASSLDRGPVDALESRLIPPRAARATNTHFLILRITNYKRAAHQPIGDAHTRTMGSLSGLSVHMLVARHTATSWPPPQPSWQPPP